MAVTISEVIKGSPAERCGILPGETLLSIGGHGIEDVLDYRFYMTARSLDVALRDVDGHTRTVQVCKPEYADLGLEFDTYLMDKQRSCKNKCVFCFIDQLPEGLRESLYFKDDDSRMSFLFGNYITLTNLLEHDVQRIIDMRISPVNISVHTTDPALRVEMMKNPRAGEVLSYIPRLAHAGIKINAQLVLCPGLNDGDVLAQSLHSLTAHAPALQSIALVPVGLTRHRNGLTPLRLFTPAEAMAVTALTEKFGEAMRKRHNMRICYAADEFYLAAGLPIPPAPYYEDFAQLENGVGLLALLEDEFIQALADTPPCKVYRRITIATGRAAAPFIKRLSAQAMRQFSGLCVNVIAVDNDFFGRTITVAGLVTGGDLVTRLSHEELGDELLFPAVMLRHEGDLFLDSIHVSDVRKALRVPVRPVPNDGYALLAAMLHEE